MRLHQPPVSPLGQEEMAMCQGWRHTGQGDRDPQGRAGTGRSQETKGRRGEPQCPQAGCDCRLESPELLE